MASTITGSKPDLLLGAEGDKLRRSITLWKIYFSMNLNTKYRRGNNENTTESTGFPRVEKKLFTSMSFRVLQNKTGTWKFIVKICCLFFNEHFLIKCKYNVLASTLDFETCFTLLYIYNLY